MPINSISLSFFLILVGATSIVHVRATTPTSARQRRLQEFNQDLVPPKRECGEVIGYTSLEDIQSSASIFIEAFLGADNETAQFIGAAKQVLVAVAKYGIVAQVLCSSCDEIRELYPDGELSEFCNTGVHGGNVTTSSLLMYPVDADQQPIVGKLKTFTHMHGFIASKQSAPSESFPTDILATVSGVPAEDVTTAISPFFETITPFLGASSGAVAIAPDYMGYAQSYKENRLSFQLSNYKMAAATHWLKAAKVIEDLSGGCQVLDPTTATIAGYSEGGAASFAAAKALQSINVDVKQISMGAPLLDLPASITWGYNEMKTNPDVSIGVLAMFTAAISDSFSSVNPDLPNTGIGQDTLSPAFQDSSAFLTDTNAWLQSEQSFGSLIELVLTATENDPSTLLNPNVTAGMDAAIAAGSFDSCQFAVEGETDLLCQAISEQSLLDMVNAEPSIRLDVCHSPDDNLVPEEINRPDYDNPNIFKFSLQVVEASGNHLESSTICLIATIVPFTGATLDANSVEPLDDPSTCSRNESPTTTPSSTAMSVVPSAETTSLPATSTLPTPTPTGPSTSAVSSSSVWIEFLMLCSMACALFFL